MKERNNYTNELSPNSGVKFDPPLNSHNSKVERINRNEKIPETDPVLWKSKPFTIEKKNFKELQKVREGSSPNKKKQQVQATENSQSMHDSILVFRKFYSPLPPGGRFNFWKKFLKKNLKINPPAP